MSKKLKLLESGIWDNHDRGPVGDFIKDKIKPDSELSFVSAYFTIYAYAALKDKLDEIKHLRFLFGEPSFIQSLDPEKTEKKAFRIENDALALVNKLEQRKVALDCTEWLKSKAEIRSIIKPGFLHGKMYHINNSGVQEAIIGSSNFTARGLGLSSAVNNIELNLEVKDDRDRNDLKHWFDEVWNDDTLVEDVKQEVLNYLEQLYQNHSPEFIYFKTLYHVFQEYLSDAEQGGLLNEKTGFFESEIWNALYEFQKDGVKGAINKILTHNGCIIADSVGLGKTFEALAVIKYFELLNGRVLVLCPKKLRDNWTVFREFDERNPLQQDRFSYTVLSHTDLSRDSGKSGDVDLSTHSWGNYDLVVIDESHNFRNNASGKKDQEGNHRPSRYEKLMEDIIKSGVKTRVLLLSATPVNTNLKDLRNQIYLITENNDQAFLENLNISSISQTMKTAQADFTKWADPKKNSDRKVGQLLDALDSGFFTLLDEITIARSRRHVENYYDINLIGKFPERLKPISLAPDIDTKKYFPSYDQINTDISKFKLSVYNPSDYVKEEYLSQYPEIARDVSVLKDQRSREHYLIGMMRVNFLKRLESSIESFEITMERTIDKIDKLIHRISHFDPGKIDPDFYDSEIGNLEDEEIDDLMEQMTVGKKLVFQLRHLDLERWQKDLQEDKNQLVKLHEAAAAVTRERDAKLRELKRLIKAKLESPINSENKKVLVFTAFSDTADYLYKSLEGWTRNELGLHIALVTGSSENKSSFKPRGFKGQTDFNAILTNFSPLSKNRDKMQSMPQEEEIDILIASDCISEGQNLQDCDYLINYDIHWNPVRIIQRFGRIDRLGSRNNKIQLVNFWPTQDLNKYINLKDRVEARMALVDLTATGEDDLLNKDQIKDLLKDDLTYREKQLLRLKNEVLDLEEMDENISLSEFTLDDFRIELLNYLKANRDKLENSPNGIYSLVPSLSSLADADKFSSSMLESAKPGVIFCLRHIMEIKKDGKRAINPLNPYYLLYVKDDGNIKFSFVQAKQILTVYQALCQGKTQPLQQLCDSFDAETENGADMSAWSELLDKAVTSIAETFKKRASTGLQSRRDFTLPDKKAQASVTSDFELVTWLIIKDKDQ